MSMVFNQTVVEVMACASNYISLFYLNVIFYPCPIPDAGFALVISATIFHRQLLTHWVRGAHICVSKLSIIGSDNGLSPGRRQATIWTNAGILIWPSGTNFSEMLIEFHTFSVNEMHMKRSSAIRRPFCLGLNVLILEENLPSDPWKYVDGLVQKIRNSSELAMKLRFSCTKPAMCN